MLKKLWAGLNYVWWWFCHEWLFDLGYFVGRTLAIMYSRAQVEGRSNMPRQGGVMITPNHLSNWDLVYIHNLLDRPAFYMTKREYFDFFFVGGLVKLIGAFPVSRGKADREALKTAIGLLKKGEQVIIFPEGTRSKAFALQEGHSGAALIAEQSQTLIVPVAIYGTEKISNKERKTGSRPPVRVRVGQPYVLPRFLNGKKLSLEEQTEFMMQQIAKLLPPEYQGYYSADKVAARQTERAQLENEKEARRSTRRKEKERVETVN